MNILHAIFTLEGSLLADDKTANTAIFKELKAQEKANRKIIITSTSPTEDHDRLLEMLRNHTVVPHELLHLKSEILSVSDLMKKYNIGVFFDSVEQNVNALKGVDVPAYLVTEGRIINARGKAPKAGKGIGRKHREPTKVVPVRLPLAMVEKYKINGDLLKKLVDEHIKASV